MSSETRVAPSGDTTSCSAGTIAITVATAGAAGWSTAWSDSCEPVTGHWLGLSGSPASGFHGRSPPSGGCAFDEITIGPLGSDTPFMLRRMSSCTSGAVHAAMVQFSRAAGPLS